MREQRIIDLLKLHDFLTFKVIFLSSVSSKMDCIFRFISSESSRFMSVLVRVDLPENTVAIIPPFLECRALWASEEGGANAPSCSRRMKF